MSKQGSALVVLSGGQDSTTCLYAAKAMFETVHAITFNYGQRHKLELAAAATIAGLAEIESHEFISLGAAVLQSASPLTNPEAELETYENAQQMQEVIGDRVELTFVPMRNALFLTIAANRAVVLGTNAIVTGVSQEDNANYPDCRHSFIGSMRSMIEEALGKPGISIWTPLINKSKRDSVLYAFQFHGCYAALGWSHTAYDGQFPPVGKDHASVLRAHGFEQAGVPDPLVIRAWWLGLMQPPNTENYRLKEILEVDPPSMTNEGLNSALLRLEEVLRPIAERKPGS